LHSLAISNLSERERARAAKAHQLHALLLVQPPVSQHQSGLLLTRAFPSTPTDDLQPQHRAQHGLLAQPDLVRRRCSPSPLLRPRLRSPTSAAGHKDRDAHSCQLGVGCSAGRDECCPGRVHSLPYRGFSSYSGCLSPGPGWCSARGIETDRGCCRRRALSRRSERDGSCSSPRSSGPPRRLFPQTRFLRFFRRADEAEGQSGRARQEEREAPYRRSSPFCRSSSSSPYPLSARFSLSHASLILAADTDIVAQARPWTTCASTSPRLRLFVLPEVPD